MGAAELGGPDLESFMRLKPGCYLGLPTVI